MFQRDAKNETFTKIKPFMYNLLSSTLLGTVAMSNFSILSKEPDCDLFLMRPVNWFLKTDALKIPNLIHSSAPNTFP